MSLPGPTSRPGLSGSWGVDTPKTVLYSLGLRSGSAWEGGALRFAREDIASSAITPLSFFLRRRVKLFEN